MKHHFLTKLLIVSVLIASCEKTPTEADSRKHMWDWSTPQAQGMNPDILDSAFVRAEAAGFVDGLLVIRNGFIVAEEYYNGYDEFRPHNIMSVSKSFLSAITGIALHRGHIDSLEERVLDYFPEYGYQDIDPRKYNITIRHLLTMRMGMRGEAEDNYAVYMEIYNSDNWIRATIESPLAYDPGERMSYNTFQTHLLSATITNATHRSMRWFTTTFLLNPMNIDVDSWERDPQGYYFGGNSMHFTPREMAVLGFLYLNDGRLNDLQIVPGDWVALSLSPSTTFTHPNEWGAYKNYNYAYLWWLGQINECDLFMAYGYGGQFVIVFPGLNLIVVSTADDQVNPDTSTIQEWAIFDIVARYVLPSIGPCAVSAHSTRTRKL
jgi:CubicO group peptidase (beta-lactamase class C family)